MVCPTCGGKVRNLDTNHILSTNETYRKKRCLECGYTFFTTEFEVERTEQFRKEWNKYDRTIHANRKSKG